MTLRSRDSGSVVPRSGDGVPPAAGAAERGSGRRRRSSGGGGSRSGRLLGCGSGVEDVLLADAATDAGALHRAEVDALLVGHLAHQRSDVRRLVAAALAGSGRGRGRRRLGGLRGLRGLRGLAGGLGRGLGRRLGGRLLLLGLGSLVAGGELAGLLDDLLLLLGLLLRLGVVLGLGLGSGFGRSGVAGADDRELGADLDGLVLLGLDLEQRARDRRGDLGVDLVGGDLEQRLVDRDLVADLLQPAGDGALGDGLTERGEGDGGAGPAGPAGRAARSGLLGGGLLLRGGVVLLGLGGLVAGGELAGLLGDLLLLLGLLLRLRVVLRLRLGLSGLRGVAGGLALLADHAQDRADLDGVVLVGLDLEQGARDGGRDLGVDLVGGDLEQRLVDGDRVTDLLEPAGDGALGDGLAECGEGDFGGHVCPSLACGWGEFLGGQEWACSGLPARARWASPSASFWVGWACTQRRDVVGVRLPAVDQLRLADELADPVADHVDAEHGAVDEADQLDEALGLEDLALAVAAQVVGHRGDRVAVALASGRLVEADRRDLRVRVGHPRDAGLVDRSRLEAGDLLGDEDALLEAAVGELETGHDVADGVDALDVGAAALVGEHEAALHLDALLGIAEAVGGRPAADRDEQHLGLDHVTALDGDGDAGVGRLDALERRAGQEGDPALAEGALERLRARLVLAGDEPGEGLDDRDVGAEGLPHAGELAADDAAAEHDRRGRDVVEAQRVLGGHHPRAVDLEARERTAVGAGGEHDGLAGVLGAVDGRRCGDRSACRGPR